MHKWCNENWEYHHLTSKRKFIYMTREGRGGEILKPKAWNFQPPLLVVRFFRTPPLVVKKIFRGPLPPRFLICLLQIDAMDNQETVEYDIALLKTRKQMKAVSPKSPPSISHFPQVGFDASSFSSCTYLVVRRRSGDRTSLSRCNCFSSIPCFSLSKTMQCHSLVRQSFFSELLGAWVSARFTSLQL